jgi:hypothetical protein
MASAKLAGRHMGRPVGSVMDAGALLAKHADVAKLLRAGMSIRHAAAICGKAKGTVQAVKAVMGVVKRP